MLNLADDEDECRALELESCRQCKKAVDGFTWDRNGGYCSSCANKAAKDEKDKNKPLHKPCKQAGRIGADAKPIPTNFRTNAINRSHRHGHQEGWRNNTRSAFSIGETAFVFIILSVLGSIFLSGGRPGAVGIFIVIGIFGGIIVVGNIVVKVRTGITIGSLDGVGEIAFVFIIVSTLGSIFVSEVRPSAFIRMCQVGNN